MGLERSQNPLRTKSQIWVVQNLLLEVAPQNPLIDQNMGGPIFWILLQMTSEQKPLLSNLTYYYSSTTKTSTTP